MATQSQIADGNGYVESETLNLGQQMYMHPKYVYMQQFPNTNGQPLYINASQSSITINLPPENFNLSKSYLTYKVTIPAPTTGNYTWTYTDTLTEISHIQFFGASNHWIADVDNLQNYLKIVAKKETSFEEFITLDPLSKLYPSNSLVNQVPALRHSRTVNGVFQGPNPSSRNYTEPAYFRAGNISNAANNDQCILIANGAMSYNVMFPLKLIKNSIFSIDKSLYFGNLTYLRLYFGPVSKVCYMSTNNTNPSLGTPTDWVVNANATTNSNIVVSNLTLMLAVDTDEETKRTTREKILGKSFLIPFVQAFKNGNNGPSQNIELQVDNQGISMMKMIHSVFNNQESLDTAYDCNNCAFIAGDPNTDSPLPQKVLTYWTALNGTRIQNLTLDCTKSTGQYTDYMSHKNQLKGSVLDNLNTYQYNWFHCDDFSDLGSEYDQNGSNELIAGLALAGGSKKWTFIGNSMVNAPYQHYDWGVFQRRLTITPQLIAVSNS